MSHTTSVLTPDATESKQSLPTTIDDTPTQDQFLAFLSQRQAPALHGGHLHRVVGNNTPSDATPNSGKTAISNTDSSSDITINGKTYRSINTYYTYIVLEACSYHTGALVGRGICGKDVRIHLTTSHSVDIQGTDKYQMVDIPIVTAGAVTRT